MNRFLLIDGPNITHAAQGSPKLNVGGAPTHAIFGFLRTMHKLMRVYGMMKPIVLWDGASWRKMLYAEYKANRDKNHTKSYERMQAEKDEAKRQMPVIKKALTLIGVDQVRAANMEADDLAAILTDRYLARGDKIVLVSGDKDWLQLVGPGVLWFDPINDRKVNKPEDLEALKIKLSSFEQFIEMKCLMGDSGDNVPGVGGIGEAGAQEFLNTYGSFNNFSNMALDGSLDVSKLHKKFQALALDEEKRAAFMMNMKLMNLRYPARPAPINLQVTKGEADQRVFQLLCQRLMFKSILKNLDGWLSVFPAFQQLEEAA